MKKKIKSDEYPTKSLKREIKKRPRMKLHGAGLRKSQRHGGEKIVNASKG